MTTRAASAFLALSLLITQNAASAAIESKQVSSQSDQNELNEQAAKPTSFEKFLDTASSPEETLRSLPFDTSSAAEKPAGCRHSQDSNQALEQSTRDALEDSNGQEAVFTAPPIQSNLLAAAGGFVGGTPSIAQAGSNAPNDFSGGSSGRIVGDPSEAASAIDALSRQIVLKEIALEKFNLHYKQNSAKQGRWKGLRYAFFNEVNASMGLAGGIISTYNRGINVHRPSKVRLHLQESANYIPMIGNIIGASAASFEFLVNEYHSIEAARKGFSTSQAKKYVASTRGEIDRLLAEREALVRLEESAPAHAPQAELHKLEGRILADLRDQSTLEFQRFHLDSRRLLAFQQMQYFFDLAKNTTNAIGAEFAYLSLHRGRRVWNYRAGVMFAISGGLTMGGPIASRIFAKGVSEFHKHGLKETLGQVESRQLAALEADQKALDTMIRSGRVPADRTEQAIVRGELYGDHSKYFQDSEQRAAKQLDKAKLVATQNIGAGLFVGGSKIASGVLFIIPGYYQLYNSRTQTATRITNSLLLTSAIVGLPASSFSIFDTLRIQVQGELSRRKLAKSGNLPGQLISARLKQLDDMEAKLKSGI